MLDELVQQSKEAEDKLVPTPLAYQVNFSHSSESLCRLPAEIVEDAAIEEAAKSLVELPNR